MRIEEALEEGVCVGLLFAQRRDFPLLLSTHQSIQQKRYDASFMSNGILSRWGKYLCTRKTGRHGVFSGEI